MNQILHAVHTGAREFDRYADFVGLAVIVLALGLSREPAMMCVVGGLLGMPQ